jgi:hypothetical protein
VIIKGTEFYDAPTRRYVDFPITDVLQVGVGVGRPHFRRGQGLGGSWCTSSRHQMHRLGSARLPNLRPLILPSAAAASTPRPGPGPTTPHTHATLTRRR